MPTFDTLISGGKCQGPECVPDESQAAADVA